jgi:hypothetical protein
MIELALDPDLVKRWLIRVGTRVDDVWHNSFLPYVADLQGRGWRGHGVAMETRKCCSECCSERLRQAQLAGAGDGFGPPLDLEFAEDPAVVAFHRIEGEEQSCPNFLI